MAEPTEQEPGQALVPDVNLQWTLEHVAEALRGLQFGAITLTVQDGVVVQVERTERKRYHRGRANADRG